MNQTRRAAIVPAWFAPILASTTDAWNAALDAGEVLRAIERTRAARRNSGYGLAQDAWVAAYEARLRADLP